VTLGPDGYDIKRDDAYARFADRAVNAAYDSALPGHKVKETNEPASLGVPLEPGPLSHGSD
jgi:hypothetical protein